MGDKPIQPVTIDTMLNWITDRYLSGRISLRVNKALRFYVRWSNTGSNLRLKNGETICYLCLDHSTKARLRSTHTERKRKRSKNNRERSKSKWQTSKKFFAFAFARSERSLMLYKKRTSKRRRFQTRFKGNGSKDQRKIHIRYFTQCKVPIN